MQHLSQLNDLQYYYHPSGDYQYGLNFLHYACRSANLPFVERLSQITNIDVNQYSSLRSGSAAIHIAIDSVRNRNNIEGMDASIKLIDFLISHGANINLQDKKGETALIKASMDGSYKLVVHLLNYRNVDVHILSGEGISAIVAAARGVSADHLVCIKALLQMGSEFSPSLRSIITKDELNRIRCVADELMADSTSAYARFPHCTLAIQSWQY